MVWSACACGWGCVDGGGGARAKWEGQVLELLSIFSIKTLYMTQMPGIKSTLCRILSQFVKGDN